MTFGLLDLPGFVLDPIDLVLAVMRIPGIVRVLFWGAVVGYAGMWIYRRHSPQQRIAEVRSELAEVQKQLARYDGEFSGLTPLIRRQFALALRQMRLTAGAALMAALPMLLVLPWLSNAFGVRDPAPGTEIRVCAEPAAVAANLAWTPTAQATDDDACRRFAWPADGATITIEEGDLTLLTLPLPAPASIVHRRHWLNLLVGNPAGYLPDAAMTTAVHLDVPELELIKWGPGWLRGWEASFFLSALAYSLWLRWRWKLN